jgi:SAM-dependent methyltransferase
LTSSTRRQPAPWLDPAIRYRKAHRLLRPGGHLAFWSALHAFPVGFDPFFTEIQEIYDAIGESYGEEWPPPPPEQLPDESHEIEASELFEDIRVRRYVWELPYTSDEYIALLDTFSGRIAMEAPKRERLYREIRTRIRSRPQQRVRRHWYAILQVSAPQDRGCAPRRALEGLSPSSSEQESEPAPTSMSRTFTVGCEPPRRGRARCTGWRLPREITES